MFFCFVFSHFKLLLPASLSLERVRGGEKVMIVVMKTGIAGTSSIYQNFIKQNKIPEYAKENMIIKKLYNYIQIKIINKSFEEIIIYNYILNLIGFMSNYIDNSTEDNLKIVDWYFIDLIINKDKIIVRGLFYDLGFYIEDKIVTEGLLELESIINDMNE